MFPAPPAHGRLRLSSVATLLAALVLGLGGACGGDATARTSARLGPPGMSLIAPAPGGCVEFVAGADPRVPIQVQIDGVYLRPVGGCIGLTPCGHVELEAGGRYNNQSTGETIDLLLRKFADREARFDVTVRVVDDEGTQLMTNPVNGAKEGLPLAITTSLEARLHCTAGEGGQGSGAGGDPSGAGGAGGTGGHGGTGGQGGAGGDGAGGLGGAGGQGGLGGAGGQGGAGGAGGQGGFGGAGGQGGTGGAGGGTGGQGGSGGPGGGSGGQGGGTGGN